MEMVAMVVVYIILMVAVLVGVAFITLMEQKILAGSQIRVGPSYVGYMGLLQPFSDAVKLLTKESVNSSPMSVKAYYFSPVAGLVLSLLLWVVYPFNEGGLNLTYGILFFICVSGLGVYPILISGWSSNCKYSMLGSLRAVAQMVSYEVSMSMILLGLVWLSGSFGFFSILEMQYWSYNMILVMPLGYLWLVTSLAETNRSPYDFAEGESELVSGFNTEYGSSGFTLIFMAEYSSILLMSLLFSIMFLSSVFNSVTIVKSLLVGFMFVWVRASLPRYRYDKLMSVAWKCFLPASLFIFVYCLSMGSVCFMY
uniref:NADH-ubiquinone oxidoreductase chain 1 n=1 Tax=Gammarus roeselii TaxID=1080772 RepID=A0A343VUM2_9CRUS|nr:NADH dehydrogenase subunit 1 [Gammarus roeselii]AVP50044.1 NADH dehydrogenase subunit 1 [Gammarus roeselii]